MLNFLLTVIKIIILLGFIILIHECGHFFVAKWCRVKVKEFAIGFGPTIWKKQGRETKYALRLIPLGGFVNMLGEEERVDEEGSFSKASIRRRILIILAGGIVNIIFGLTVYFIIMSAVGNYMSTTVESVEPNYGAQIAGIEAKDEVIKINGKTIRLRSDVDKILANSKGEELEVLVKKHNTGSLETIKVTPTSIESKRIGIYLGVQQEDLSTKIKQVFQGTPAAEAGLKAGDEIFSINDVEVDGDSFKAIDLINTSGEGELEIGIVRENEQYLEFKMVPQKEYTYYLGVKFELAENNFTNNIYHAFWDTVDFSFSIVDNLRQLFSGKVVTESLMGPVGISQVVSETQGIVEFIYMIALISLSLGVTNLLPFPPLDGGKVVIYIIEAIRRKPMKQSLEVGIQMAGFAILIGLSIYVTYNDILRIF